MKINPILVIDSYKLAHISMYPEQIKETYLNLTPRVMKYFQRLVPDEFKYDNKIVAFGVQMAVTDLVTQFAEEFFSKPLEQALKVLEHLDGYVEGDNVYWTEDKELAIRLAMEILVEKLKD